MQDRASHSGEQLDTLIVLMQEVVRESGEDVDLPYWWRTCVGVDDAAAHWERLGND